MLEKTNKQGHTIYPRENTMPGSDLIIKNGRVIDPSQKLDERATIRISQGRIHSISTSDAEYEISGDRDSVVIDAKGMWIVPGLIDMHVHLRQPGREDKETIESGTCAAAAGGFTAVACMPNTTPVLDNEATISSVMHRSQTCPSRVFAVGAITQNLAGEHLTSFASLMKAGARAFSDDGKSVFNAKVMADAFALAKSLNTTLLCHCEDKNLADGGVMHQGAQSARLGLAGIPSLSEEIIVSRDILLASHFAASIHICHVSTARSVSLIRQARQAGVAISAETCPHYLAFTDTDVEKNDPNKKMNPPLRSASDRSAILEGIADGTIDVIATDHAPHCVEEKKLPFENAPFGVIGLETAVAAAIHYLVKPGILSPQELIRRMSCTPGRILNTGSGNLANGQPADITIIDPDTSWRVDSSSFFSKSRNTPFEGMKLTGFATWTIVDGRVVYARSPG
ncbi:MAG: dihydroorotase [Chitinivibrionales bacterium]|nr:dihydroorotase [Chitinivibrionales bacterium]